jgi:hypothetical protein
VHAARRGGFVSCSRPPALGLFGSVALVVWLSRMNITQAFAGAIFGVSQPSNTPSHLKTRRMLSEGGRYRAPIEKYQYMQSRRRPLLLSGL